MGATQPILRDVLAASRAALSWRSWHDARHAVTDTALVLSLLSGGCMSERPAPDDDDDDDCGASEACPEEPGGGPDPDDELPPPSSPDEIPGTSGAACCSPHAGLGCQVHAVESCVCGLDPKCCTEGWDATCVMTAEQLCQSCSDDSGPWG